MTAEGFDGKKAGDGSWWLLKVPTRLGSAWNEAAAGTVLGEVEVSEGSMRLKVVTGAQSTHDYDMVRQPGNDVALRPFRRVTVSEEKDGEVLTRTKGSILGGQPVATLMLNPKRGTGYRRDLRFRMVESMQPASFTKVLDEPEAPTRVSQPIVVSKRKRDDDGDDDEAGSKRQRAHAADHDEIKRAVIGILARPDVGPLPKNELSKLLAKDVLVSPKILGDVLKEVCTAAKADGGGRNLNVYQLKPEYRVNAAAS